MNNATSTTQNTTTQNSSANRSNRTFRNIFRRIASHPYQPAERPSRRGYQYVIAGTGLTLVLAACGGGDDANSDVTRDFIAGELMEATGLPEADVDCIVDSALDQFSLEQLATMSGDDPDPEVEGEIVGITTDCLLNSDNLDEIIANEMDGDEDAADQSGAPEGEPVAISTGHEAPPTTTPPAETLPPTTVPATTLPPTPPPTTEPEIQLADSPFCVASADYYVSVGAVDELMDRDAGTPAYNAAFKHMFDALDRAVDAAPTPELRVEAETARTAMRPVYDVMVELDFDVIDLDPADYGIEDQLTILEESGDRLEGFLADFCDTTVDTMETESVTLAGQLIAGATIDSAAGVAIMDDLERIYVEVPASWTSVDGAPGTEIASVVAGLDTEGFLTNWSVDGVRIRIMDEGENADWTSPIADLEHFLACDFIEADTYDDGAYFGTINTFENCSRAGTDAAVIVATNSDAFDLAVMVEIQMVEWDQDVADLILSSFLVR